MTERANPILSVLEKLLSPTGCPWDREQTPRSLCDYLVEETFELVDAIRADNLTEIREELGDVFFLLFFMVTLLERQGLLTLEEVMSSNAAKMIRRHPHVFGETEVSDRDELLQNWERIKAGEKASGKKDASGGLFDSLPPSLPPMLKAYRINSKAARVGFTCETDQAQEDQLAGEWQEWVEARASENGARQEEEFGDYLFALVEHGRRNNIKANAALDMANQKFLRRFAALEQLAREEGTTLDGLDLAAMNALWDTVKSREPKPGE